MPEANAPRTLLAFDFGTKNIGVAIGQELTRSSTALDTLHAREGKPDWNEVRLLLDKWKPDALVVGIPLEMDGGEQAMTHAARRFANRLKGRYHLPVLEADERLTSRIAEQILKEESGRKPRDDDERIHQISAQLILDTFFSEQDLR